MDIPTHRDYRRTRDAVLATIEPGFAVLGLGGDGTANHIGNIMMEPELAVRGLQDVPFVPRPCGNANDIARSYYGRAGTAHILRDGQQFRIRPLEIRIPEQEGADTLRYALGYFSIGAAAFAAGELEAIKSQNRLKRYGPQQVREVLTMLRAVAQYPEFLFELEGTYRDFAADLTFARGSKMAKHGKLHADATLPAFECIATPRAGNAGTCMNMLRLATGRLLGRMMSEATSARVQTIIGEPLPLQYDGETRTFNRKRAEVASGTRMTVGIAERSFPTLLLPGLHGLPRDQSQ